jgi:hypothetical protein
LDGRRKMRTDQAGVLGAMQLSLASPFPVLLFGASIAVDGALGLVRERHGERSAVDLRRRIISRTMAEKLLGDGDRILVVAARSYGASDASELLELIAGADTRRSILVIVGEDVPDPRLARRFAVRIREDAAASLFEEAGR